MHRLEEMRRQELVDGENQEVIHYISNCRKNFDDIHAVMISRENDRDLLLRLTRYLFSVSYDSEQTPDGGWNMPERIDGNHRPRLLGEIFYNKFVGCMGEIALYKYIKEKIDDTIQEPNLTERRGYLNPDQRDLNWNNADISIKTTLSTHNMLLLQQHQYNDQGEYVPNVNHNFLPRYFNYHVLCRLRAQDDTQTNILLSALNRRSDVADETTREHLKDIIINNAWLVDIPGYISHEQFANEVIQGEQIAYADNEGGRKYCFGRSDYNNQNLVDVNNYYVQSGDLTPINKIKEITRTEGFVRYSDINGHYAYIIDDSNNEYKVSTFTYDNTPEADFIFNAANRIRISFTVVKKSGWLYANDIRRTE